MLRARVYLGRTENGPTQVPARDDVVVEDSARAVVEDFELDGLEEQVRVVGADCVAAVQLLSR